MAGIASRCILNKKSYSFQMSDAILSYVFNHLTKYIRVQSRVGPNPSFLRVEMMLFVSVIYHTYYRNSVWMHGGSSNASNR